MKKCVKIRQQCFGKFKIFKLINCLLRVAEIFQVLNLFFFPVKSVPMERKYVAIRRYFDNSSLN